MRRAVQIWADEPTVPKLHTTLKEKCLDGLLEPFKLKSFKVDIDLFCNSQTQEEKLERIEVNRNNYCVCNISLMLYYSISLSVICHFKGMLISKIQMLHFYSLNIMV